MRARTFLLPFLTLLGGCWALLEGPSGSKAMRILKAARPRVEQPAVFPKTTETKKSSEKPPLNGKVSCTLDRAVVLALQGNREFLSRKEDLLLQAMNLASARYVWDPQVASTVSYLLQDTRLKGARGASSGTVSAGVTQKLPWGGTVSLQGSSTAYQHHADKASRSATSSFSFSWDQPLLKGMGPKTALEGLIQARRNLLYELRRFELYRQDFGIRILSRFFNLVRLEDVVKNAEGNFKTFENQYRQANALFAVDRVPEIDVFRAEREMERARNDLEVARDTLASSLDDFKVFLGLDTSVDLVLVTPAWLEEATNQMEVAEAPERLPYALPSCIEAAIANRLDLRNIRNAQEDATRAVDVAANGLLPALDLNVQVGLDHDPVQDFEETNFDAHIAAGLKLGIPWDFRPERDAFFRARIAQERAKRATVLLEEQIRQDVRERFRSANQVRLTIYIQNKIRRSAAKRLRITEYRFREGEIGNRDVVEAQDALLAAENRYVRALTDRQIRDLELARALGILHVDEDGMPRVPGWPSPAKKKPEEKGTEEGKEKESDENK
ncbi:MAG: TolC family protein [Planctomycetota bacterium]|jgi:outer membrane protein TolC